MESWLLKREYSEKLISAETDKVKFSNIERKSNSKIFNNNIYLLQWIKFHNPWFLIRVSVS